MRSLFMFIVVLVFGLMPRPTHPCHGSGPRTIKEVAEQDEDRVRSKQGMMPNKTEGFSHLKEEREKLDPNRRNYPSTKKRGF